MAGVYMNNYAHQHFWMQIIVLFRKKWGRRKRRCSFQSYNPRWRPEFRTALLGFQWMAAGRLSHIGNIHWGNSRVRLQFFSVKSPFKVVFLVQYDPCCISGGNSCHIIACPPFNRFSINCRKRQLHWNSNGDSQLVHNRYTPSILTFIKPAFNIE